MTASHVKSRPDGGGAIQNEDWNDDDISLHQHQEVVGAAAAALTPSRVESAVSEEAAATSSPLDDYLHNYPSVSDFVLSIPSRQDEMPSDNEHNNEDGSCNESILSDITEMTYRAELMKEVSSERSLKLFAFMCCTSSNFFFFCMHRDEGNYDRV